MESYRGRPDSDRESSVGAACAAPCSLTLVTVCWPAADAVVMGAVTVSRMQLVAIMRQSALSHWAQERAVDSHLTLRIPPFHRRGNRLGSET